MECAKIFGTSRLYPVKAGFLCLFKSLLKAVFQAILKAKSFKLGLTQRSVTAIVNSNKFNLKLS